MDHELTEDDIGAVVNHIADRVWERQQMSAPQMRELIFDIQIALLAWLNGPDPWQQRKDLTRVA